MSCGDGTSEGTPDASDASVKTKQELHTLRNVGLLQASSDTKEGYDAAAAAFRECVEQGGNSTDALNLARVLVLSTQWDEALTVLANLRESLKGSSAPIDIDYLEGVVLKNSGDPKGAIDRLESVTTSAPTIQAPWYQLGLARVELKDSDKAVVAFEKLFALNAYHQGAIYNLMMTHQRARDIDAAARWNRELKALKARDMPNPDPKAYMICKYTRVRLVPAHRATVEPPAVKVQFTDWKPDGFPVDLDGIRSVLPFDYDGDGDDDLYIVRKGANVLLRNDGGKLVDVSELSDAADENDGRLAVAADFDNDAILDVFLAYTDGGGALYRGLGEGMFQRFEASGIDVEKVLDAKAVDYDHDGDLDLVVLERPESTPEAAVAKILRNNGDRTFASIDSLLRGSVKLEADVLGFTVGDFDLGNDIDFAFGSIQSTGTLQMNQRQGEFRRFELPALHASRLVFAVDVDNDGDDDLIGVQARQIPPRVLHNQARSGVRGAPTFVLAEAGSSGSASDLHHALSADLDNDGDPDVVVARSKVVSLFSNRGGMLEDAGRIGMGGALHVSAVDLDLDGRLDVIAVLNDGHLGAWRNTSADGYPFVRLRLIGARDNRDGVGSTVEMYAGDTYQRVRVDGPGGVRIGLGTVKREDIEGFTILWPNGIRQSVLPSELKWNARGEVSITQKAGLVVSCPFLYTFDGTEYRFITDVVGIAPLDEWVPPGTSPHLDPEEYVRIPASALAVTDGKLRLVITEELRETTYLDRVRLVKVFHPRNTTVRNDESTRQGGVEPLRLFVYNDADVVEPASVSASSGANGAELSRSIDGEYFHGYTEGPSQWAGWVEPWSVDVVVPDAFPRSSGVLLLTGRIAWQDSGVAYALHQHGRTWKTHGVEVVKRDGSLEPLLADAGFPCGMDRTIVVPLEGLPGDVAALRLSATSRLLWDRIALATRVTHVEMPDDGVVQVAGRRIEAETLELTSARLGWHGYSKRSGNHARHEQTYDFESASPLRDFPSPIGLATPYGDVREMTTDVDDRLVIIPPGDAVWLETEPGREPRADESVTYFLKLTGWAKESGFHNETGRTIGPLPFHEMKTYPEDAFLREREPLSGSDVERLQTRRVQSW
jgi:tetratricopeptide (TPR) repeat protein